MLIHALALVDLTHNVMFKIINQSANASMVMKEIRMLDVMQNKVSACFLILYLQTSVNASYFYYSMPILLVKPIEIYRPCNPSPCGANAICSERNGAGSCTCMQDYFGDPYISCRPECIQNSDCDRSRACVNKKCVDPCPGSCGLNADCIVRFHSPHCQCYDGYSGDARQICSIIEISKSRNIFSFKIYPNSYLIY